jgi:hypothetical protein
VRKDLSPAQICVQAAHAAIEVARTLSPEVEHPHLVLLGVNSEVQLLNAWNKLEATGIGCKPFFESDMGDQLTAIASGPIYGKDRDHFRRFNLLQNNQLKEVA